MGIPSGQHPEICRGIIHTEPNAIRQTAQHGVGRAMLLHRPCAKLRRNLDISRLDELASCCLPRPALFCRKTKVFSLGCGSKAFTC